MLTWKFARENKMGDSRIAEITNQVCENDLVEVRPRTETTSDFEIDKIRKMSVPKRTQMFKMISYR